MKIKKLLSIVLSLAMLCTMLTAFGVTASAADNVIEVSDIDELLTAIDEAQQGTSMTDLGVLTKIKLTADIEDGSSNIEIGGYKNIEIDFNGHTLRAATICTSKYSAEWQPSSLTLLNGTYINTDSNLRCLNADYSSSLTLKNMTVQAADDCLMHYGVAVYIKDSTAVIENCLLISSSSDTNGRQMVLSVIDDTSTVAAVTIKNSTLQAGAYDPAAQENDNVMNDPYTVVVDGNGTKLNTYSLDVDTLKIGTGYIGNVLTPDGLPIGKTPVSANATIPAPTYTVTIPSTIDMGSVSGALEKYRDAETDKSGKSIIFKKDFTVTADGVNNLFDGKTLAVSIGTTDVATTITGDGNTIPCKLNKGDTAYTEGSEFASFVNDVDLADGAENKQTGSVSINRCDITKTADYTGTITFNIEIKEGN